MPTNLTSLIQQALIVVAVAGAFTWFGVYDVNGPVWLIFAMWMVTIGTGMAASVFVMPFVFGTRFEPWPLAFRILAGAALIAGPVTLALYAFAAATGEPMPIRQLPLQYAYVLAVSVIMVIGGYMLTMAHRPASGPPDQTAPDAARAFLARLPLKYRQAELYAISSEDHYLRVHTSLGEELILMRLADAVRDLNGAGGLQVHRSWWVAQAAVKDVTRDGGRLSLVLPSGKLVPVSRTYQSDAKAAGLI